MHDQVAPFLVGHGRVADTPAEVDVLQHALQRLIGLLERGQGLVEPVAHLMVQFVAQIRPPGPLRHEERLPVEVAVLCPPVGLGLRAALSELALLHPLALLVEHVAGPLQEQSPEDVLLELRRIHLPPQDVRRREKMPLKLRKRQHAPRLDAPERPWACLAPPHQAQLDSRRRRVGEAWLVAPAAGGRLAASVTPILVTWSMRACYPATRA